MHSLSPHISAKGRVLIHKERAGGIFFLGGEEKDLEL